MTAPHAASLDVAHRRISRATQGVAGRAAPLLFCAGHSGRELLALELHLLLASRAFFNAGTAKLGCSNFVLINVVVVGGGGGSGGGASDIVCA